MLVVVLVLENPDRFAIRLTEQISCRTSVSLRPHPTQCTEDEHDDEDEDDSKFRNLDSEEASLKKVSAYRSASHAIKDSHAIDELGRHPPHHSAQRPCQVYLLSTKTAVVLGGMVKAPVARSY